MREMTKGIVSGLALTAGAAGASRWPWGGRWSDTLVPMTLSGRDVIARMRADAAVLPGQVVDLAVDMDKAVAFDPA